MMTLLDGAYSIQRVSRIDDVDPAEWDSLSAGRSFVDHRWQRLREAVYTRYEPTYLLLRRDGRLDAAAVCLTRPEFAFPNAIPNPFLRALVRRLAAPWRPLRCGALDSCQPAFLTRSGVDCERTLATLLHAIEAEARQQRVPAISVVCLGPADAAWRPLLSRGYRVVRLLPNTYLDVHWLDVAAYQGSLPRKKRKELARHRRRARECGVSLEVLHCSALPEQQLRRLVRNVFDRHRSVDPHVPDLFTRVAGVMGSDCRAVVAIHEDHPIGCVTLLRCRDEVTIEWMGLDYSRSQGTHTYHCLLVQSVEEAIAMGARRVWFGDTVYELKRDVGASLESRYAAVRLLNPGLNRLLGAGLRLVGLPTARAPVAKGSRA